jgi:magnesium transporter
VAANWIDLLDPTPDELREAAPTELEEAALELLTTGRPDLPRPTLQSHGNYIFGIFVVPVAVRDENAVYYQEVDVILTREKVVTVRKTPGGSCGPFDPDPVRQTIRPDDEAGMIVYRLLDDIAERFLDVVEDVDAEIDELEDQVNAQPAQRTRARISELRHDLLQIRRMLSPTRDAVRLVVANTVDVEDGPEVFTRRVEVAFNLVYDKLMRAVDGLDLSRDLLASVRDFQQAKIANDQNDVTKRLTALASLLLVPTFIVGVYGQNFVHIPELHWHWGYWWSWGLIVGTTIAQLVFFRRKGWL